MGIFSGIKDTYKKSEAAVIVQNLLEHIAAGGFFDVEPAPLANKLVGDVWDARPDVFGGRFGQRPHRLSVAAAALAHGVVNRSADDAGPAIFISLGNLLTEVARNGSLYPLNSLDRTLLTEALDILIAASPSKPSEEETAAMYQLIRGNPE